MADHWGITRRCVLTGLAGLALAGCNDEKAPDYRPSYAIKAAVTQKVFRVGCPFHTPESLFRVYQPLIDHINRRLDGAILKLEAARDYESFEQKLYYRNLDFALCNPYQMLMAEATGYRIFAKMADDSQYHGLILTRADAPLSAVSELSGQVVCYAAASALASAMLPQAFLREQGIDVQRDLDNRYVGSEESAMLNVLFGKVAAGATWPLAWRRFQREETAKAEQLAVRWQTPSLPGCGFVARADVPADVVGQVTAILLDLQDRDDGRRLLDHLLMTGFVAADTAAYAPVTAFLRRFNDNVRPVALP